MQDLTAFQRDLLYVIESLSSGGEKNGVNYPNGLAIKEEVGDYYGEQINHGRLYPNLDTLVEKGLVDKFEIDKRTNGYALTRRGRREMRARAEWQETQAGEVL